MQTEQFMTREKKHTITRAKWQKKGREKRLATVASEG